MRGRAIGRPPLPTTGAPAGSIRLGGQVAQQCGTGAPRPVYWIARADAEGYRDRVRAWHDVRPTMQARKGE